MNDIEKILTSMRASPANIQFDDATKAAKYFFGEPRKISTSHHVYKMPWNGDPRVNLQRAKDGKAEIYQIK
jgi:hypothetical protein